MLENVAISLNTLLVLLFGFCMESLVLGGFYALVRRAQRRGVPSPATQFVRSRPPWREAWVACEENRLMFSRNGLAFESMTWTALCELRVVSKEWPGHLLLEQRWYFSDGAREVDVPATAIGMAELLARLSALPGFDAAAQEAARKQPGTYMVWRKASA